MKSVDAGSAVLAGRGGDALLLVWKAAGEVSLPVGRYRVRTTRVERTVKGEHWFLSSSGPKGEAAGKQIKLHSGKNTIDLGDEVRFKGLVRGWRGTKLLLGFGIRGKDGRGLSVYRQDKRVPVRFRVLDKRGKTLKEGTMNYG